MRCFRERVFRRRNRTALTSLVAIGALAFAADSAWAQDKSGSKEGLVKLPSAGGTVSAEGSTFLVQGNTGAANYSIPLPELPGRAGVAPGLKLTYNQMSGDPASGFGSGWRVDVSSIDVSSEYGVPYATSFATNDNIFRLNGQRLLSDPNKAGQYRLQTADEEIKVRYHASPFAVAWGKPVDGVVPSIPSGFEVVYPDGRVELYTGDASVAEGAGALITRFPLVYEVQRHGESVAYKYTKSANKAYLREVAFASGLSRYTFDLLESSANVHSYKQGFFQSNGRLVQRLVASYAGEARNRWCFVYAGPTAGTNGVVTAPECRAAAEQERTALTGAAPVHDRLVSVLRYGSTAAPTASGPHDPRSHFEYSSWDDRALAARPIVYPAPALQAPGIDATNFELLDANRDGLPDVLKSTDNAATQVFFGDAALSRTFATHQPLTLKRNGTNVAPDLRFNSFQVADINGDSFVDMIEMAGGKIHIYGGGNEQSDAYQWRQTLNASTFDATTFEGGAAQFVDVNQDGLSDIVTTSVDGQGRQQWTVYLNVTTVDPSGSWAVDFVRADFALPFASTTPKMLRDVRSYRVVDVNGDGLPDFTWTNGPQGFVCVYENTGEFFQNPQPSTLLFGRRDVNDSVCGHGVRVPFAIPTLARSLDTWMLDVNGDGIKDFVSMGETVRQLSVWYGLGDLRFSDPTTVVLNTDVRPGDLSRSRVADIDGDGQEEIVVFQPLVSGAESVVILDFNRTPDTQLIKSGLLTAVETEGGVRHDIRYATSTDEVARDQNQSLSPNALHFPVIVAKQVVRSSGKRGETYTDVDVSEYFYHNPYFDPSSREFRGFGKVDRVAYGDEGSATPTQETAYIEETFATYDPSPLNRQLSGRLLTRRVSAAAPDAALLQKIRETSSFDPTNVALHSLSTATQAQSLARGAQLLEETTNSWSLVEQVPQSGAYFAQLQATTTTAHGTSATAQRATRKTVTYDAHDVATTEREVTSWSDVPLGVTLAPFEKVTAREYDPSRRELARFEAVALPSEERTTVNGTLVDRVHTDFDTTLGLPTAVHRTVFQSAPAADLLRRAAGGDADLLAKLVTLAVPQREELSRLTYDTFGNATSRADAFGLVEEASYGASGVLPSAHRRVNLTDRALDQITTMTYLPSGRLAGYTNPLGLQATLQYDELGRRSALHYSDGGDETYQYRLAVDNQPNLLLTTTRRYATNTETPTGESETVAKLKAYRTDGVELGEVENADDGGVRVLQYHTYNRKKNRVFTYTPYLATNLAGRRGITVQDLFDLGQIPAPAQADSPDQVGTQLRYDPLDRLSRRVFPNGKDVSIQHEPWGTLSTETYPVPGGGQRSRGLYEIASLQGLVAKGETGEGHTVVTRFARDAAGHVASIALDGEPTARRFTHDASGKQEYQFIPGVGDLYTLHDGRGRPSVKLALSKDGLQIDVTELEYDSLDRPVARWENGRLAQEQIYDRHLASYQAPGELQPHVALPTGLLTVTRSFDSNNRYDYEEQIGYDARGATLNRTVQLGQRTFSENFRRTLDGAVRTIVTPRGLREEIALNRANRLSSVAVNGAGFAQPEPVIEAVTYNPKDQIAGVAYRRNAKTTIAYDPQTLLTKRIDSTFRDGDVDRPLQSLGYEIDGDMKITAIHDDIRDSVFGSVDRSAAFQYDWRGELTGATRYQRTTSYAYDAAGGFTANDELPGQWRAGADTKLLALGTDANPFDYDAFGRLHTSPEISDARYDAVGQLVYVRTTSGKEITYGYTPQGARLYKRVVGTDGAATESLYPVQSYTEEPSGAQSFLLADNKRLVRFDHGRAAAPDRWFYYLQDHIGSNDILMSADGAPVEQSLYFPYGSEASAHDLSSKWTSYLAANADRVPEEKTHNRYTDHYLDDETGLYYFGARYYHAKLGRFATPDPLFVAEPERCAKSTLECNLYGYANNNPLTYFDPDGREVRPARGLDLSYYIDYINTIPYLAKSGQLDIIAQLQKRPEIVTLRPPKDDQERAKGPFYDPTTKEIVWDPRQGFDLAGKRGTPALILLHESAHALDDLQNPVAHAARSGAGDPDFDSKEEKRVIETIENPAASKLGEPIRKDHHSASLTTVKCSTCTN